MNVARLFFVRNAKFLSLLALPALAWLALPGAPTVPQPSAVELALRRAADGLLRLVGDSTSQIQPTERPAPNVWRLRIDGDSLPFEQLAPLLEDALARHGAAQDHRVAFRRCESAEIDWGYLQQDFLALRANGESLPCAARPRSSGCHFIEIEFLDNDLTAVSQRQKVIALVSILGAFGLFLLSKRKKTAQQTLPEEAIALGERSYFEAASQTLVVAGAQQRLTFREAKLLRLFAENPDQLLERERILREVWADEGVLVGRSLDMFVSRLRKKLAADSSVAIVAAHGVGYRLETRRV